MKVEDKDKADIDPDSVLNEISTSKIMIPVSLL